MWGKIAWLITKIWNIPEEVESLHWCFFLWGLEHGKLITMISDPVAIPRKVCGQIHQRTWPGATYYITTLVVKVLFTSREQGKISFQPVCNAELQQ
jgi:hypothetical protein